MNILIGGSRSILSASEVLQAIHDGFKKFGIQFDPDTDIVLSGAAPGPDTMSASMMEELGATIERHPAQWSTKGKAAGSIRNQDMVDKADYAIFIWDGNSRGTQNAIRMWERKYPGDETRIHIHKVNLPQHQEA